MTWWRGRVFRGFFAVALAVVLTQGNASCAPFNFQHDTFAFKNATVLKYKHGHPILRRQLAADPTNKYTRRCFVMSRSVIEFRKFARFDPHGAPLDDRELGARIRAVMRRAPWKPPLPENQRIIFPGYANLREASKARVKVFEKNLGSGFLTYFRPANARMFFRARPQISGANARQSRCSARPGRSVCRVSLHISQAQH